MRRWMVIGGTAAGLVALSGGSAVAAASTYAIPNSGLTQGAKTYYTTSHTVHVSDGTVELNKTDGPGISISWYICGQPGTGGTWKTFPNPDPTGYITLGNHFILGTKYCIAAYDTGGKNPTDTWRGTGKS